MKERAILVTGAGGGIGSALVDDLMTSGYTTVLCQYRSESPELKHVISKHEKDLEKVCFQADLTDEAQVTALHAKVAQRFGPVWGLVNLAGASTNAMSWKMSAQDFRHVMDANLLTTFLMCREFTPEMREHGGRILNTSSVVAFTGTVGAAHYCAAKAAIVGYTRALALELSSRGVTANTLALGYFDRGLITHLSPTLQEDVKARTPLKRFGHVEELSGLVKFLLSDAGAFTTGQTIHMNGGLHL